MFVTLCYKVFPQYMYTDLAHALTRQVSSPSGSTGGLYSYLSKVRVAVTRTALDCSEL